MRTLLLVLCLAFLAAAASAQPATPQAARPVYKNPLDVTVDEKGQTARVVLTGTRTVAVVDLATGKIKEETPWEKDKSLRLRVFEYSGDGPDWLPVHAHNEDERDQLYNHLHSSQYARLRAAAALPNEPNSERKPRAVFAAALYRIAKSDLPATQVAQGWLFTNQVAILTAEEPMKFASLDGPNNGLGDARDLVISPTSKTGFIAVAGSNEVVAFDLYKLRDGPGASDVRSQKNRPIDLAAGRGSILAHLPTQSNPRRLGLSGDGKTLVVSNYLSDSITVIDTEKLKVVKHIPLGGPEPNAARRGEVLFNSARLTQFGQFTCASCHPNGGADGLNWDLPRDGIGNFKNTKSLLGVKDTAPYGWLGTSPTLADRVAGTLRTLHRYEPSEDEVNDLVAYLETLEAPAKPQAAGPAIERGRALFAGKARCDGCHSGSAFDDGKLHDVGTGAITGEERINTPSLRGLSSSAPYLHDGRAATLDEVFSKYNEKKKHGDADRLTKEELADLVAYLRSL